MSELSISELETQHIDLLPERETLGSIVTVVNGGAASLQTLTLLSANGALNIQNTAVTAIASANFF